MEKTAAGFDTELLGRCCFDFERENLVARVCESQRLNGIGGQKSSGVRTFEEKLVVWSMPMAQLEGLFINAKGRLT